MEIVTNTLNDTNRDLRYNKLPRSTMTTTQTTPSKGGKYKMVPHIRKLERLFHKYGTKCQNRWRRDNKPTSYSKLHIYEKNLKENINNSGKHSRCGTPTLKRSSHNNKDKEEATINIKYKRYQEATKDNEYNKLESELHTQTQSSPNLGIMMESKSLADLSFSEEASGGIGGDHDLSPQTLLNMNTVGNIYRENNSNSPRFYSRWGEEMNNMDNMDNMDNMVNMDNTYKEYSKYRNPVENRGNINSHNENSKKLKNSRNMYYKSSILSAARLYKQGKKQLPISSHLGPPSNNHMNNYMKINNMKKRRNKETNNNNNNNNNKKEAARISPTKESYHELIKSLGRNSQHHICSPIDIPSTQSTELRQSIALRMMGKDNMLGGSNQHDLPVDVEDGEVDDGDVDDGEIADVDDDHSVNYPHQNLVNKSPLKKKMLNQIYFQ